MPRPARRIGLFALAVLLAVTGCGVSPSSPVDIGEGLAAGAGAASDSEMKPPTPDLATSSSTLVSSYLEAAVGGGESSISQVREFQTVRFRKIWAPPPAPQNPIVIRLTAEPRELPPDGLSTPSAGCSARCAVEVRYRVVGVLNDQGRVDDLSQGAERVMIFYVAPLTDARDLRLRIDEIKDPAAALMLSDAAVSKYYTTVPVYFWDAAGLRLVPDLRYYPRTVVGADTRANTIVQWLVDGPSAWLAGAQRLPVGTTKKLRVVSRDGKFVVDLSVPSPAATREAQNRLNQQLLWSLSPPFSGSPGVELRLDGKLAEASGEYLSANAISGLEQRPFNIVEGKVTPKPPMDPPLGVLNTKENAGVVSAAVNRGMTFAAFVRKDTDSNKRSLTIVRDGGQSTVVVGLAHTSDMGRPAWIPDSINVLLVPSAGRLYAVVAADGRLSDVTPWPVNVNVRVRTVAISPDGRRVAMVVSEGSSNRTYVSSLNVDPNGVVAIGPSLRAVLAEQIAPVAVAWDSQASLYVAGTVGNAPVLWQVTADGTIAQKQTPLLAIAPTDVVAYPKTPASSLGRVLLVSGQLVYNIAPLHQESEYLLPFFAN